MSREGLINRPAPGFRCYIVPRFVYAQEDDFNGQGLQSPKVKARAAELVEATVRLAKGLALAAKSKFW